MQNGYIAKLEILGKTNENRKNIANPQYAKYRTSKVKVLKIFHMSADETQVNDEIQIIKQMNGLHDTNFVYTIGEEIRVDDYDEDVNVVCSRGIHYFKTPYQAKMWNLSLNNYTGKYIEWHDNGNKKKEEEYKDGRKEEKFIEWHRTGTLQCEGEFKDGKLEEKWIRWYDDGQKESEGEYKDGEKEGKWIAWHRTGNIWYEGEFKDGKLEGKWIRWYDNGQKESEGEYKDGKFLFGF